MLGTRGGHQTDWQIFGGFFWVLPGSFISRARSRYTWSRYLLLVQILVPTVYYHAGTIH